MFDRVWVLYDRDARHENVKVFLYRVESIVYDKDIDSIVQLTIEK